MISYIKKLAFIIIAGCIINKAGAGFLGSSLVTPDPVDEFLEFKTLMRSDSEMNRKIKYRSSSTEFFNKLRRIFDPEFEGSKVLQFTEFLVDGNELHPNKMRLKWKEIHWLLIRCRENMVTIQHPAKNAYRNSS